MQYYVLFSQTYGAAIAGVDAIGKVHGVRMLVWLPRLDGVTCFLGFLDDCLDRSQDWWMWKDLRCQVNEWPMD